MAIPLLSLFLAVTSTGRDYSTGAETWQTDSSGNLSTTDWPLQSALELDLETSAKKEPENAPPVPRPKQPRPALPELKFSSDFSANMMGVADRAQGGGATFFIRRSMIFDPQRRAIRVLDIITSTQNAEADLTLTYTNRWRSDDALKVATPRELFPPKSTSSYAAMASVSGDSKLPVLLFLFGAQNKGWSRTVKGTPDTLQWSYTGKLPANSRVIFLHWLALTQDVKKETLRNLRSSLVKDGLPADARVDEQVLKELANFPMPDETPSQDEHQPGELPLVKALAEELSIEPDQESDQLVLGGMSALKGEITVNNLRLQDRVLSLKDLAAVQGGAAIGRKARVFFRDGSILSGTLSWESGSFKSASVGTITLTPEGLDTLFLRAGATSDPPPAFAALWVASNGDVQPLSELPNEPLHLRWAAGRLEIPWSRIVSIRRLEAPDLEQEVLLKDGSRIRGWLQTWLGEPKLGACMAYATTWPDLVCALQDQPPPPAQNLRRLMTANLSLVTGDWAQEEIILLSASGPVTLPVAEIRGIKVQTQPQDRPPSLEVTTATGSVLRGAAAADSLAWRFAEQPLNIPWSAISEVVIPAPPQPRP